MPALDTIVTPPLGGRREPLGAYNFVVEIDGLLVGGFSAIQGLDSNVEVEQYTEGGLNGYIHMIPGETRYPNLVLSRGLTDVDTLWNWYEGVTRGVILRRNATILLLDRQRAPVTWWNVRDALPVRWSGPRFDAMG